MGGGNWSSGAYDNLKKSYTGKSTNTVFSNTAKNTILNEMSPLNLTVRESRDINDHPNTIALAIFLDVTGSMGRIPDSIARHELGSLMEVLLKNNVKDAQIMFGAIGDHISDTYPLQIGQYESATDKLNHWLTSINLEGGGGGGGTESYLLAWLVAGRHSSIDCFDKRKNKGFLFTIGDEQSHTSIDRSRLQKLMGYSESDDVTDVQLLKEAQRMYHVFHIHCQEGQYRNDPTVIGYWKKMLGERVILMDDHTKICEVIAGIVATMSGADVDDVVSSFDTSTALIVRNTVSPLMKDLKTTNNKSIIVL